MTPTMTRFKGSGSVESSAKQHRLLSSPVESGESNLSPLVRLGSSRKTATKTGETVRVTVPQQDPETLDNFFVSPTSDTSKQSISTSDTSRQSISTSDLDMISPTEPLLVS